MDKKIRKLYIGIQLFIYVVFLYLDIVHPTLYQISNYLKFTSILICVVYVIISFGHRPAELDRWLLLIALIFTLISDWFIVIVDYYSYGLITFIMVQYLYWIRIQRKNNSVTVLRLIKILLVNVGITCCIIPILISLRIDLDRLIVLSLFYIVTFIMNIIQGCYLYGKRKDSSFLLFIIGLSLFLMCDINVAIFNLTSYFTIHTNCFAFIEKFSSIAMWMFYLPAQVIISITSLSKE